MVMQPQNQPLSPERDFIRRLESFFTENPLSDLTKKRIEHWLIKYREDNPVIVYRDKPVSEHLTVVYRDISLKDTIVDYKKISPEEIIKIVSRLCDVPVSDIMRRVRKRRIVEARFFCMYFMRLYTSLHLGEIGEALNKESPYDHTTIIHGVRTLQNIMKNNEDLKDIAARIDKSIQQKL